MRLLLLTALLLSASCAEEAPPLGPLCCSPCSRAAGEQEAETGCDEGRIICEPDGRAWCSCTRTVDGFGRTCD